MKAAPLLKAPQDPESWMHLACAHCCAVPTPSGWDADGGDDVYLWGLHPLLPFRSLLGVPWLFSTPH